MATQQKISTSFQPPNATDTTAGMGNKKDSGGGGRYEYAISNDPGNRQRQTSLMAEDTPAIFDLFYEEFLTNVMKDKELSERIPKEFVQLESDYERVEYLLLLSPQIRNFQIQSKYGMKSLERSTKYREEGNKLFQSDQTMQSILFYNKSIAYAPHPDIQEYTNPAPPAEKVAFQKVQFSEDALPEDLKEMTKGKKLSVKKTSEIKKHPASPYEALSFCYANRSAALRKLNQYEECLRDVARAAKFGYPKENVYKLWERKGKCYLGLKRFEQASKCLRQAVQCLKESNLSDNQKKLKSNELHSLMKEWKNTNFVMPIGDGTAPEMSKISENPEAKSKDEPIMGATGQYVLYKEPVLNPNKKLSMVQAELAQKQQAEIQQKALQSAATSSQQLSANNSLPPRPDRLNRQTSARRKVSGSSSTTGISPTPPMTPNNEPEMNLQRTPSQISISQISHTGVIKLENIEIPELSYGQNARMLSASSGIDVCFTPDKGRYFAATHDLYPGKLKTYRANI